MNRARMAFLCLLLLGLGTVALALESFWIEAETLDGINGYCWPMAAAVASRTTNGHWGLSGPGCSAEWMQGGESGFLSIACGAADASAVATKTLEIPAAGQYYVWVRYRDNRGVSSRFQVRVQQQGAAPWTGTYGVNPVIEEDNVMKLYWGWAFGWGMQPVTLKKGAATLSLLSAFAEQDCRQIDVIVVTDDPAYRPRIKDRPASATWDVLASYRARGMNDLEPLARQAGNFQAPNAWTPKTFREKGFLYLWNVDPATIAEWAGADPAAMRVPYHLRDADVLAAFKKMYAGKTEVPIFSDPRIVPTFHASGPKVFDSDAKDEKLKAQAELLMKWLDAHPDRFWAGMLNYAPDTPISAGARANFTKYRDRFVGAISGENLGYFDGYAGPKMAAATAPAKTRRELADAISAVDTAANDEKYQRVFGEKLADPYRDVIPCQSVGMTAYAALCYQWGARTVGYESAVATNAITAMNLAFLRGAARQNGGLTATYRSCNFGDSATMFSEAQMYNKPSNIYDNFYDVFSGAGMTWYKFDIWYQYMAGASMFYHEQGFDEFWMPGGMSFGRRDVQLSPKGQLVDRFLKLTAREPDRGVPFTPVAMLVDYAHGWGASMYTPDLFDGNGQRPDLTKPAAHSQMLREYMNTAFYPIGPKSEAPITATSETFVPGVFGDIFDVIYAYPDVKKWTTINTYPVVIVAGEIALTQAEGKRLAEYVQQGGTLLLTDAQLSGPGVAELNLPKIGDLEEAAGYRWLGGADTLPSQLYRFRAITGGRALATTANGQPFCAAFDRGRGRLIVLAVPHGLGVNGQAVPAVARLFGHLTRGLMPVEVEGDVEWMVNKLRDGWAVTLLNPAGDLKPQHGLFPSDFRENREIVIRARVPLRNAHDRLMPGDRFEVKNNSVTVTVPAGGVRVMELN